MAPIDVKNRLFKGLRAAVVRSPFLPRGVFLGAALSVALGCPLYEEQCDSRHDCAAGYRCDRFSQRCEPVSDLAGCVRPGQCGTGETCTPDFVCRPGSCDYHGCVSGYRCGVIEGAHACVPDRDAAAPADASGDGAGGVTPSPDASNGSPPAPNAALIDGGDAATPDGDDAGG